MDDIIPTSQSNEVIFSTTSLTSQSSNESLNDKFDKNNSSGINAIVLTPFETRVVPSFYVIICIVGLLGNGIVIGALTKLIRKNRIKSVNDILVINLAIADFIFVGCLPFWASQEYLHKRWLFGMAGCKLLSFNTLLNLYASVFFIVAMGLDRCVAVVFVTEAIGRRTPKRAVISCVIIWMSAVAVASQALVYRQTVPGSPIQCVWNMPDKYVHVYYGFRVAVGFFIPFGIMLCCYVMIIIKLKRRMANNMTVSSGIASNQRKITAAILAVMSLFVICWLPNHIVTLISAVTHNDAEKRKQYGVETANLVSVCLAYANSALNPILYAFMKGDIRQESKKMINSFIAFLRPIGGFNRARRSISRFRGMKLSIWRSTTGTAMTTATTRYREVAAKHNFVFPDDNQDQLVESPPSHHNLPANEILYKREDSDGQKVNLMVNVTNGHN